MTKIEALKALNSGHKVTHIYFTSNEWVKLNGFRYEFEDGIFDHIDEFWYHRRGELWDNGWSIFK